MKLKSEVEIKSWRLLEAILSFSRVQQFYAKNLEWRGRWAASQNGISALNWGTEDWAERTRDVNNEFSLVYELYSPNSEHSLKFDIFQICKAVNRFLRIPALTHHVKREGSSLIVLPVKRKKFVPSSLLLEINPWS